jgi:hypothetical protein
MKYLDLPYFNNSKFNMKYLLCSWHVFFNVIGGKALLSKQPIMSLRFFKRPIRLQDDRREMGGEIKGHKGPSGIETWRIFKYL